jgi:hypothetical protein
MAHQPELLDWLTRIEAEYREMPGLQLTVQQVQRLWGLNRQMCSEILELLVSRGVLWETPKHAFALADAATWRW